MHKNIVYAIQDALTKGDRKDLLKINIQPQKTEGFWSMTITPKEGYSHFIAHIKHIGKSIGQYYGEGLWCMQYGRTIKFS